MIRGLKVTMYVWGGMAVLVGLLMIALPEWVAQPSGLDPLPEFDRWLFGFLGALFIASGSWTVVAGRDPVRHINWVKYQITKNTLVAVVTAYALIQGNVTFGQAGLVVILFALAALALLAFYPWRMAHQEEASKA